QAMNAVSFMGQKIQAFGDSISLSDGSGQYNYTLPADAASTSIVIKNSNGDVVRTITNAPTTEGTHELTWDGKDDQGNKMADGLYTFSVTAKDSDKNAIDVTTGVSGVVKGVTVENGVVVLDLGNGQTVKVTDLFTVTAPPAATTSS
ncbi:MAG: flagellar hook assembly protein FlgD, partial [Candidatus Eiseniibacteriota bacterium]